MTKKFDFDLVVIGSGTAGTAAAFTAAQAGQNVAIVESELWGGCSPNSRDLPFRAASTFSHLYRESVHGSRFGLSSGKLRYNYPALQKWQALAKKRATTGLKKSFEKAGITCLKGLAHFMSPYELSVGSVPVSAPKFIIASGATLNPGGIIGVESVKCLNPNSALEVSRPPKTLLIVGGGATGCEFAEYFTTLGTKVCLVEVEDNLLPKEDPEAGQVLEEYFTESLKIKVLTGSRIVSVSNSENGLKATMLRGGQEKNLRADAILLATGSKPALDLGLENAGVKFDRNRIIVDNFLQTSMKHIWAAGDCIGGESSAERAAYEGAIAASNAASRQKNLVNYSGFVRVVDVFPGLAFVGLSEVECKSRRLKYKKSFVELSSLSASNTSDFQVGFLKLLADNSGKIIGATLMSPDAELVVQELALAVRHRFSAVELASTPHVSSSWSEIVRLAAKDLVKK